MDGKEKCEKAEILIAPRENHRTKGPLRPVDFLVDSGVYSTIVSKEDWVKAGCFKLKPCKKKFTAYNSTQNLKMLGSAKVEMRTNSGLGRKCLVYVTRCSGSSLLGLKDGRSLGVIHIEPDSQKKAEEPEVLSHVEQLRKPPEDPKGVVSDGQTQEEIDTEMKKIVDKHPKVFTGLGKAKVAPVEVKVNPEVKPRQEKPRRMAMHLRQPVKEYLEEMEALGLVTPLPSSEEHATGWISNLVVTKKKWDSSKIRVNMDTRHMEDAIVKAKYPIPTMEELRHEFRGSDRFSVLDMNHAFLQFELAEEAKKLFVFQTP